MDTAPRPSRFFSLPPELRDMVYEASLDRRRVHCADPSKHTFEIFNRHDPAFELVNKQFREELLDCAGRHLDTKLLITIDDFRGSMKTFKYFIMASHLKSHIKTVEIHAGLSEEDLNCAEAVYSLANNVVSVRHFLLVQLNRMERLEIKFMIPTTTALNAQPRGGLVEEICHYFTTTAQHRRAADRVELRRAPEYFRGNKDDTGVVLQVWEK